MIDEEKVRKFATVKDSSAEIVEHDYRKDKALFMEDFSSYLTSEYRAAEKVSIEALKKKMPGVERAVS